MKTITPYKATNSAAQWDIEDGIVTLGKTYNVERREGNDLYFFRNNNGELTSCANFEEKK
jgi:hypothetical protein